MSDDTDENERLRGELAEARATIAALVRGHVDAGVEGRSSGPLREAQLALRRSEQQLRAIFDGALDAMVIADDEGRYVDANPAACELFGVAHDAMVGRTAADFTEPDFDFRATWRSFLDAGSMNGEFQLRRPDGQHRTLEYRARANILPGRHLSVLRDITERRVLEEQLRHAQKMESIGRFAGGIAHDFNNMLAAILGFAMVARTEVEPGPVQDDLDQIVEAAERAARLTTQLLAFGRRQLLSPKVVEANALVDEMHRMLRRIVPESVELDVVPSPDAPRIEVDRVQLEHVVVNLVANARDAMPDGGTIRIETSVRTVGDAEARLRPGLSGGHWAVIAVEDTGVGMGPEVLSRIFEPFFTTKPSGRGTGLGLATAYGIVKQSGGHIEASSAPGMGSVFEVYLPLVSEGRPAEHAQVTSRPEPMGCTATVLLVEDEPLVRRFVAGVLARAGYTVLEAGAPTEAMVLSERHPGAIDVLLTDVVMPGMSGPELAERLVAARPATKVLFMSGYPEDELASGEHELLTKPFPPRRLLAAIRRVLGD